MPGELRTLGGEDIVRILCGFGFNVVDQRGSHLMLRRLGQAGGRQTLHIPLHREIRRGTLRAIHHDAKHPSHVLLPVIP